MIEKDKSDKIVQVYSALIIGFVCIVIGLPLWWFTTNVYRASLPYAFIEDLDKSEPILAVNCEVVFQNDISKSEVVDKLHTFLDNHLNNNDESQAFVHQAYEVTVRNAREEEVEIINRILKNNFIDLERHLSRLDGNNLLMGQYRFYVLSPSIINNFAPNKSIAMGLTRNVFIKLSPAEELAKEISRTVKDVLVRENDLSESFLVTKRAERTKPNKDSMRSLRSSLGYDLIFTLMNPQPDKLSVHWQMQQAVEKFLNPFIKSLSKYVNINVRSQYIHLTGINIQPEYNANCQCFVLPILKLPHIINPIEPYLASHVTNNPTLNFVVYVPTREQSPLIIFDHEDNPSLTNAFLVPRWGGLMIHNIEIPPSHHNSTLKKTSPFEVEVDHKKMFSIFLPQLKSLLGFRKTTDDDIEIFRSSSKIIADWELDAWLFERCIENIGNTASTLQSLSLLLNHINNIVINDDVAQQVNMSVTATRLSFNSLFGAQFEEAFLSSKQALNSSETAFFDPTLLELLYFPEDQKFAIYIPLFLPVGIPVVNSIYHAVSYLKNRYFPNN